MEGGVITRDSRETKLPSMEPGAVFPPHEGTSHRYSSLEGIIGSGSSWGNIPRPKDSLAPTHPNKEEGTSGDSPLLPPAFEVLCKCSRVLSYQSWHRHQVGQRLFLRSSLLFFLGCFLVLQQFEMKTKSWWTWFLTGLVLLGFITLLVSFAMIRTGIGIRIYNLMQTITSMLFALFVILCAFGTPVGMANGQVSVHVALLPVMFLITSISMVLHPLLLTFGILVAVPGIVGVQYLPSYSSADDPEWGFDQIMVLVQLGCVVLAHVAMVFEKWWRSWRAYTKSQRLFLGQEEYTDMLEHMMPLSVLRTLLQGTRPSPDPKEGVSVMFAELVLPFDISTSAGMAMFLKVITTVFEQFDRRVAESRVYKVFTFRGDYLAVSGLPIGIPHPKNTAQALVDVAFEFQNIVEVLRAASGIEVDLKVGIHTGPVTEAVVGGKMPRWSIFGDTVNTASRMKSNCPPNCVQVSHTSRALLGDATEVKSLRYHVQTPWNNCAQIEGPFYKEFKGKGILPTYLVKQPAETYYDFGDGQMMRGGSLTLDEDAQYILYEPVATVDSHIDVFPESPQLTNPTGPSRPSRHSDPIIRGPNQPMFRDHTCTASSPTHERADSLHEESREDKREETKVVTVPSPSTSDSEESEHSKATPKRPTFTAPSLAVLGTLALGRPQSFSVGAVSGSHRNSLRHAHTATEMRRPNVARKWGKLRAVTRWIGLRKRLNSQVPKFDSWLPPRTRRVSTIHRPRKKPSFRENPGLGRLQQIVLGVSKFKNMGAELVKARQRRTSQKLQRPATFSTKAAPASKEKKEAGKLHRSGSTVTFRELENALRSQRLEEEELDRLSHGQTLLAMKVRRIRKRSDHDDDDEDTQKFYPSAMRNLIAKKHNKRVSLDLPTLDDDASEEQVVGNIRQLARVGTRLQESLASMRNMLKGEGLAVSHSRAKMGKIQVGAAETSAGEDAEQDGNLTSRSNYSRLQHLLDEDTQATARSPTNDFDRGLAHLASFQGRPKGSAFLTSAIDDDSDSGESHASYVEPSEFRRLSNTQAGKDMKSFMPELINKEGSHASGNLDVVGSQSYISAPQSRRGSRVMKEETPARRGSIRAMNRKSLAIPDGSSGKPKQRKSKAGKGEKGRGLDINVPLLHKTAINAVRRKMRESHAELLNRRKLSDGMAAQQTDKSGKYFNFQNVNDTSQQRGSPSDTDSNDGAVVVARPFQRKERSSTLDESGSPKRSHRKKAKVVPLSGPFPPSPARTMSPFGPKGFKPWGTLQQGQGLEKKPSHRLPRHSMPSRLDLLAREEDAPVSPPDYAKAARMWAKSPNFHASVDRGWQFTRPPARGQLRRVLTSSKLFVDGTVSPGKTRSLQTPIHRGGGGCCNAMKRMASIGLWRVCGRPALVLVLKIQRELYYFHDKEVAEEYNALRRAKRMKRSRASRWYTLLLLALSLLPSIATSTVQAIDSPHQLLSTLLFSNAGARLLLICGSVAFFMLGQRQTSLHSSRSSQVFRSLAIGCWSLLALLGPILLLTTENNSPALGPCGLPFLLDAAAVGLATFLSDFPSTAVVLAFATSFSVVVAMRLIESCSQITSLLAIVVGGLSYTTLYAIDELTAREQFLVVKATELERQRCKSLLQALLPSEVAEVVMSARLGARLTAPLEEGGGWKRFYRQLSKEPRCNLVTGTVFHNVSLLFLDICSFTSLSSKLTPTQVVNMITKLFTEFDDIVDRHGAVKVETIGDAYFLVTGAPTPRSDHARTIVQIAREFLQAVEHFELEGIPKFQVRIGIHCGDVVAGMVGRWMPRYHTFGGAVERVMKLEAAAPHGRILASEHIFKALSDAGEAEISPISTARVAFPSADVPTTATATPKPSALYQFRPASNSLQAEGIRSYVLQEP